MLSIFYKKPNPFFKKNNSFKLFFTFFISVLMVFSFKVFAAPPASKYSPGETLAPTCAPGDINCTVTAPATSGSNSDITELTGLTTDLSIGQGGTGASTASGARVNLGLGNVENTAISTWTGSTNLTTLGTITSGTWNGTAITDAYVADNITASNYLPLAGGTLTGNLTLNAQSDLRLADTDSSNYVGFQSPSTVSANILWTLPSADGTSGQILSTDGSGTLSWVADQNTTYSAGIGISISSNAISSTLGTAIEKGELVNSGTLSFDWGDSEIADILTISGGTIDNTSIGATAANSGAFTTLSSSGNTTIGDASLDSLTVNASTVSIPNNLNFDSNTLFIDSSGNNVGIGNASPGAKLDVSGSAKVSGNLTVDTNTLFVDGASNVVGIGTNTPNSTALLDLTSTTKGFLAPRMTTTQRDAITSPATGLQIYNTTTNKLNVYNGSAWVEVGGSSLFTDGGTTTYLTSQTDDVAFGGTDSGAPFFFDESAELLTLTNTTSGNSFRVNDQASDTSPFVIDASGNVGVGTSTPASKLDVNGSVNIASGSYYKVGGSNFGINNLADALYSTTDNNLFLGHSGGSVGVLDNYNVALGGTALDALDNSDGDNNVAIGYGALTFNTSGDANTAVGPSALQNNVSGSYNTAQGISSMSSNSSGSYNSAYGSYALSSNTSGIYNAALGYESLYNSSNGNMNVAVGYQAGAFILDGVTENTTGDLSVFIGAKSKPKADDESNQIVIGYKAIGLGSNTVVLGNDNITTTALKGKVGIGGTSPGAELTVYGDALLNGSGRYINFGTATSSSGYGFRDNSGTIEFKNSGGSWTGISNYFTDGGTTTYLTSQTDDVAFGGTDSGAPFFFDESAELLTLTNTTSGNSFRVNDQAIDTSPFVIDASGNVGVGTTTPSYKLDIYGTLNASATTTLGSVLNVTGATTISNLLTVNNSAYTQATFKTSGTADRTSLIAIENNNSTSTTWQLGVGGTGNGLGLTGGEFYMYDASATSKPTRFMIDSSGNVGIGGTTAPAAKLHIDDNGTTAGAKFLQVGDDGFFTDIDTANTLGLYGVGDSTVGAVKLGSGGPTLYGKSGNLGIGTTAPSAPLHIKVTNPSSGIIKLFEATDVSGLTTQYKNSTGSIYTGITTNATGWAVNDISSLAVAPNFFVSRTETKVGVGTSSPGAGLDVVSGVRAGGGTPTSYGNGTTGYSFRTGGDTDGGMFSPYDGILTFVTNNTERMRIDGSGRVGIGASPSIDLAIGDNDSGLDSVGDGTLELYTNGSQAIVLNGAQMAFPKIAEWDSNDRILCYKRTGGFTFGQVTYGGDGTDCYPSSIRYKKDVEDLPWGIDELMQLRPVKYKYKDGDKEAVGFIAEEVNETDLKWYVNYNDEGQVESLKSRYYPALIVKAIQDMWKKITGNTDEIKDLKQKNQELENRIKVLEGAIGNLNKQSNNLNNNSSQNNNNISNIDSKSNNLKNDNQNQQEEINNSKAEDDIQKTDKNIEKSDSFSSLDTQDNKTDVVENNNDENQNNNDKNNNISDKDSQNEKDKSDTSNVEQQDDTSVVDNTEKQAQNEQEKDVQEVQNSDVNNNSLQGNNNTIDGVNIQ